MGGKTKTTQQTSIDPAILAMQTDNFRRAKGIADTPYQPYSGAPLDLSTSLEAARGLSGFEAPQISAAALDRGAVRDVSAGSVGADQIGQFMNPYTDQVVNSFLDDNDRQRLMALSADQAGATGAGAFGGSRHGVAESLTNEAALRTGASGAANLRAQGYSAAVGAAQAEAARALQAQLANQGVDLSLQQANAMLEQQTRQANQSAALSGAGIQAQGANLLGDLQGRQYDNGYQRWQAQYNDPFTRQALLNSTLGTIQAPSTTTGSQKTLPGVLDYANSAADLLRAVYGQGGVRL